MDRHGRLKLEPTVRESLLPMTAVTMDRLLTMVRDTAKQVHRRRMINTTLPKSIPVRTFGDPSLSFRNGRGGGLRKSNGRHLSPPQIPEGYHCRSATIIWETPKRRRTGS